MNGVSGQCRCGKCFKWELPTKCGERVIGPGGAGVTGGDGKWKLMCVIVLFT